MTDIAALAAEHTARLIEAHGAVSPLLRADIETAAELLALAQAMRRRIVTAGEGDLGHLAKIEELAANAVERLPKPATGRQVVDVTKLSDSALAELEAALIEDGAQPRADGAAINELLELNAKLNAQLRDMDATLVSWQASRDVEIASAKSRAIDAERRLDEVQRELANISARAAAPAVPVADAPVPSDNVVAIRPPASPFAGLGASITGPLPPHAAHGPEYSP